MKIIKLIIKGILLYSTLIFWLFVITAADSFTAQGLLIILIIGLLSILLCKSFLSMDDVAILTGNDPKDLEEEI